MRLPRFGIVVSDDSLRRRVERWFHKPMIVLAILVLPLLAVEFLLFGRHPELRDGLLGDLLVVALAVIWLAFFIEFVIKIVIAESRVEYVRRHWIDVAIIVLPLLRPLRIARVARTARVFTLRGVGVKMARYGFALFLGVEAGDRLARRIGLRRDGRRDPARMTRHQLIQEVRRARRQVDAWEAWFDEHRAHREEFGVDHHFDRRDRPPLGEAEDADDTGDAAAGDPATNHEAPDDPPTGEAKPGDAEAEPVDRT